MKKAVLFAIFVFILAASQSLAATYTRTVTNCADDAAITGSLRWALTGLLPGTDIIFDITTAEANYSTGEAYPGLVTNEAAGKSWYRIIVYSGLPSIASANVYIRGLTQTREATNPRPIEIRSNTSVYTNIFAVAANNVTIEGLVINKAGSASGYFGNCVYIGSSANYCNVIKNYFGCSATGEGLSPQRSYYDIYLDLNCNFNKIGDGTPAGRNIIAGNYDTGIFINNAFSNEVIGNYIGTNVNGNAALGNGGTGVTCFSSSAYNKIGGGVAGNVISGNSSNGIYIYSNSPHNFVLGNYIGTNASGEAALPNGYGIYIADSGSQFNKIGDGTALGRNIISGNSQCGIRIEGCGSNEVLGNYIGTTASGEAAIPSNVGIAISSGAKYNKIGDGTANGRNIISGNSGWDGIDIYGSGTNLNEVKGNYIGANRTGTNSIPNGRGIMIYSNAAYNKIGGGASGEANLISGNISEGINIYGNASSNEVKGNLIGTNITGSAALSNSIGVNINNANGGAVYNLIGGSVSGEGNVISGNSGSGVNIAGSGTNSNLIQGNYIGTTASGEAALANSQNGIYISSGAQFNRIGNAAAAGRNIISGNTSNGIHITGAASSYNYVLGNYIGTNYSGNAKLANLRGIFIETGGTFNKIGDGTEGGRNIISGNTLSGVTLRYSQTMSNEVLGNYIGTNASGEAAIPNGDGAYMLNGAAYNRIGNGTLGGKNIISGNSNSGVYISSSNSNEVLGNYIGTTASGEASLSNNRGVLIDAASSFNVIGGNTAVKNIISGNTTNGLEITETGSNYNQVLGNYIGINPTGSCAIGNANGVYIHSGPRYTRVGNSTIGGRNVISGNGAGVYLEISVASNEIKGNYIGLNADGNGPVPNSAGIALLTGAAFNQIGDGTALGRNIISGNTSSGISFGGSANSNVVFGNYIGTDKDGGVSVANNTWGVIFSGASTNSKNQIGAAGKGNVISGNGTGIFASAGSSNEIIGNYIGVKANGVEKLPNTVNGIDLHGQAVNYRIGDGTAGGANVISGNNSNGIYLYSATSSSHEIKRNCIGTDASGDLDIKNGRYGIYIKDSPLIRVGPSNVIANNGSAGYPAGISIEGITASSETITQNSIYSNYGKGIALIAGANHGILSPEVTSTSYDQLTGLLQITGTATPNALVEIFMAQGNQGKTYLGNATANGTTGNWTKSVTRMGLVSGDALTATATNLLNETSEFGMTKEVTITNAFMYQPDLIIGTLESGADYIGETIFENTPVTQVKTDTVATNEAAICYIKMKNAGNAHDTITVTGEGSSTGFTVKYYGSKTGTEDTTAATTGAGEVSPMDAGASGEGRVEVTYTGTTIATKEIIITAISSLDGTKKDSIKAIMVFNPLTPVTPTQPGTKEFTETQLGIPGMHITIPEGATTIDAVVTAVEVSAPGSAPVGYMIGGKVINIQSNVTQFAIPVTVTMPITGPLAAPRVEYWDGTAWSTAGIVVVSYTNTSITFTTTHFTIFAPMGAAPGNTVRFGPNPYNPNNGSGNFWYWLDASKDTSIYLLDLGGTIVWKNSYSSGINGARLGENNISYDGKTSWGDVLGNGVYLYKIVQDSKSIGGGKIAVIK